MKILVVDDDKIIRMGLAKKLKRLFEQHEVLSNFQNGLVALEYLKENEKNVDLVITDIKMPVMTGIELIEKATKELIKPPIFIVLSGYDEFNYVRDTMKSGATNYLLKPIKQEELENAIAEVEIMINDVKKKDKIFNKSIEVLKKDFFKHILFSNKNLNYKTDKTLLENIQLDEDYIYKMVVIQRDKDANNSLFSKFIKEILNKYETIEHLFFYYEDTIYVVFYFRNKQFSNVEKVLLDIAKETEIFIENNKNVYILEPTENVWKLREQSKLARKVKEKMYYENKAQKYYLNITDRLDEVLNDGKNNSNMVAIKLAKEYIIKNFNKNITLKDVADNVFLSQNYLSELFKKELGEGFYDFLSNYRIKKAKEILITTNMKIYEVAEKVGYNDSITFGRAFKKITGTTANNFRNDKEQE